MCRWWTCQGRVLGTGSCLQPSQTGVWWVSIVDIHFGSFFIFMSSALLGSLNTDCHQMFFSQGKWCWIVLQTLFLYILGPCYRVTCICTSVPAWSAMGTQWSLILLHLQCRCTKWPLYGYCTSSWANTPVFHNLKPHFHFPIENYTFSLQPT